MSSRSGEEDPAIEVAEDLAELRWHLAHIRTRLGALRPLADPSPSASGALEADLERRLAALDAALGEPSGPGASRLAPHQDGLRRIYQALALLETAPDWHSSPGSLCHPVRDLTPLSHVPGYNDYQRGYLPWAQRLEQHFLRASQPGLAGRALLFSSGMGAIQTALQFVMSRGRRLLLGRRTYYETQTLLSLGGARERLRPLDEAERRIEVLAERVREVDAIFADTITLDRDALPIDPALLYGAIEASGRTGIELVLDNTVPGPRLQLPPPPPGVRLYVVESLLKNYQAGLDLAAAGVLIAVASADAARDAALVHDLEVLRSTNGTNISAYSARLLPLLPRERLLARLERQARNARLLAEGLRDRCEVSLVAHAGILFCAHPSAAQLITAIELLALARRARVLRGTSFGFNDTRVALVPGLDDQVRFACGMEHRAAMTELVTLVRQAVAAIGDPAVRARCVHLSRFFPAYPQRTTPEPDELEALARYARDFERLVLEASGVSAPHPFG